LNEINGDGDGDVTSAGKMFHVCAAATGNARSPSVDSRVDGTSNAEVDDESWRPGKGHRPEVGPRTHCGAGLDDLAGGRPGAQVSGQ